MNKVKLNPGITILILLASFLSGWSTLLIVSIIILAFCETNEKINSVLTKIISFLIIITLVTLGWNVITNAFELFASVIEKFVTIINCYLDIDKTISLVKFNKYFITPINTLLSIITNIITFIISVSKVAFVLFILSGKELKENSITKKVNKLFSKIND